MEYIKKSIEELVKKFSKTNLLSGNMKLDKGSKEGWKTLGLQLLPYTHGGGGNLCPSATTECANSCIFQSGNARFKGVNQARFDRTQLFLRNRPVFLELIKGELSKINNVAGVTKEKVAIRLNTFSDIGWEKFIDMESYKHIQFYDYTKVPTRMSKFIENKMAPNYHLTFSFSGDNLESCKKFLDNGANVAMVFAEIKNNYEGYKVVDGDENDLTFEKEKGVILGLRYKNSMVKGINDQAKESKFVIK
jgi:hypothetical protein